MDQLPNDLFELVTQATSVSDLLPKVVSRLNQDHIGLEQNQLAFDFYVKQVIASPFIRENIVDTAVWLLGAVTNPQPTWDDASNAIVLALMETFVTEDSQSICAELVARNYLPKLKEYVMMKHGKWASRPAIRLMYDTCRLNRLSRDQLAFVDKEFLEFLFDLVEQTRYISEELEDYNYSVIRLVLVFNEQFIPKTAPPENPIISLIISRLNSTKTLSENTIFIFNRAEDSSVQLLITKFLYLVFTVQGTRDWVYTNDLGIVVDVVLRESVSVGWEQTALQQAYIRLLSPLLLNTRLVSSASFSKLPEVQKLLDQLAHSPQDSIDPTVKRVAERTLAECAHLWGGSPTGTVSPATPPSAPGHHGRGPAPAPPAHRPGS